MARYSRVALYHKAKNASHNQPKLTPIQFKKNIVKIPEAQPEQVNMLQHQEDKKHLEFKPVVETLPVEVKETKVISKAKKAVKRSTSSKKKVSASKTKKQLTGKKKTTKKAAPAKSKKAVSKAVSKKAIASKKAPKKTVAKKMAAKKSSKASSAKKMLMKKSPKKPAGSNKKNTKPVLKRHTKKSN